MRIGILTFHAAHNYGAVLQCYALQTTLENLGHSVSVIDYRNKQILKDYKIFDIHRFIMRNPISLIKRIIHEISYYKIRKSRSLVFKTFIDNYLHLCPVNDIFDNPFDLIIVGSDQVWNYNLTGGFDAYYWGEIKRPKQTKIASYAASMQDSWSECYDNEIYKHLAKFDYLSVRENKLAVKLKRILPTKKICTVVDPTLLLKVADWNKIAHSPEIGQPYLLLYQVDAIQTAENIADVIAKERQLKVVKLFAETDKSHTPEVASSSPADFVGLFKHASFVVCSSFHGTVFSILYHKNFYSMKVEGKNSRVETLLQAFGLESRMLSSLPSVITDVDYSCAPTSILDESLSYIHEIIRK